MQQGGGNSLLAAMWMTAKNNLLDFFINDLEKRAQSTLMKLTDMSVKNRKTVYKENNREFPREDRTMETKITKGDSSWKKMQPEKASKKE